MGTAIAVGLRRRQDDGWTPAPAGDGPVPSYREDPVPDSQKTVSSAEGAAGDSTPADSDLGEQTAQLAEGDETTTGDAGETPGQGGDKA